MSMITYLQFTISLIGLGVSSGLLIYDQDNSNIYLPCITAIVFAWLPSPIQNKKDDKVQPVDNNRQLVNNV